MATPRPFDYPAGGRVRTGTLYPADQDDGPAGAAGNGERGAGRPCLILVHGLTACRRLPEIERLAALLSARFDVLAIDLRGHGDSPDRFTWGREEHRDLSELIGFLRSLYPAVGVLGFSIGGFIAIASAALARDPAGRPDALCTVGAPAHLKIWRYRLGLRGSLSHARMLAARKHRWLRPSWPSLGWARADHLVARVAPAPLLVIHGEDDWLVPPRQGRAIHDAAAPPRELLLVPGGLHAEFLVTQDPRLVANPARAFFERELVANPQPGAAPEVSLSRDRP